MHDSDNSPLLGMVDKLSTQTMISSDDRAALLDLPYVLRTFDPGTYLVREGDLPDRCGVLITGFSFRHKTSSEGNRQIVAIHIPGEMLDLQHLHLDVADHNVQTLTRCAVATIPRDALRMLANERPAIYRAFFTNVLIDASIYREWILNIGRRNARARIAHFLCEFAVRLDNRGLNAGQRYELPMTQEQLGDALGLTAVHVNRTLKILAAEGLITREKRGITFPSWDLLRKVSEFNTRYLHISQKIS